MSNCKHNRGTGLCAKCKEIPPYHQFKLCKNKCLACNECGYFWGPGNKKLDGQRVEVKQFIAPKLTICPTCNYYVGVDTATNKIINHLPHLLFLSVDDLEQRRKACKYNGNVADDCKGSGTLVEE